MSKPSDERNGCFLDSNWCCKVCDGEIPDGHTDDCDIWKIDKQHRVFLANEYSTALTERDALAAENERLREALRRHGTHLGDCPHNLSHPECDWNKPCDCGLDAALKEPTT